MVLPYCEDCGKDCSNDDNYHDLWVKKEESHWITTRRNRWKCNKCFKESNPLFK